MTDLHLRPPERSRPLIAVVCTVPLLGEAMEAALDFAEVRLFSGRGDVGGLLQWLHPDAVVVDASDGADNATAYATEHSVSLVHIGLRDGTLRLFQRGEWQQVENGEGPTPDAIRNVIAGALFAREGAGR